MIEILCKTEEEVREIKHRFADCEVNQKCKFKVLGSYAVYVKIPKQSKNSNRFCEWKKQGGLYQHKTSCGSEDSYDDSYKYCPYCGKAIVLKDTDAM